jgi:dihydrofolate synthase/folylpolyglutamate synthase
VAGSKGKGSTTAFLASILTAAGYRTGRYTSPHLHTFRERIAVDDLPVTERAFSVAFDRSLAAAGKLEAGAPDLGRVTAFELVTAAAFDHFARAGCDIAVIETGLGGRWDATNVVDPLVSVITLIDLEHTEVLGDTLAKIAAEKAGIIKPGRPVVMLDQAPEALDVFLRIGADRAADVSIEGRDWTMSDDWRQATFRDATGDIGPVQLGLHGSHQTRNAGLAIAAIRRLPGFSIERSAIEAGLASAWLPGRYEVIPAPAADTPEFVIDGAHSPASARALVETVLEDHPGLSPSEVGIVFGMLRDKNAAEFARELSRLSPELTLVELESMRTMSMDALEAAVRSSGASGVRAQNLAAALARQRATDKRLVIITGSLALAAEARVVLGLGEPERIPQALM